MPLRAEPASAGACQRVWFKFPIAIFTGAVMSRSGFFEMNQPIQQLIEQSRQALEVENATRAAELEAKRAQDADWLRRELPKFCALIPAELHDYLTLISKTDYSFGDNWISLLIEISEAPGLRPMRFFVSQFHQGYRVDVIEVVGGKPFSHFGTWDRAIVAAASTPTGDCK
jgi:hypothetical protein